MSDATQAETALRESERKYRELVENANSIILRWNPEGEITFLNEFGQKFFGWNQEEILSRNVIGTIVPETESTGRNLRQMFAQMCRQPLSYQRNVNENVLRDGRRVWIAWTNKAVFDSAGQLAEVLSIGTDITERREAEQALRESEARYRALFDNALEGIYQSTPEGTILAANPALARMLGYHSPEELIREVHDLKTQVYADPVKRDEFRRTLDEHGTITGFEHELLRKDGTRIWVLGNARAVRDEEGRVIRYEGSLEDITHRKVAEQERQRLMAQLVQAQKMEAVGQLAGGVAHDFNNILASILLHAGLLRVHPDATPEVRSGLSELEAEAARAANLTRQLLTFSRRQFLQRHTLNLNSLIEDLLKMLRRLIGEHINLEFRNGAEPLWVRADPGMLEQVIVNLVVNARDAMPRGGRLSIVAESVTLDESCLQRHPEGRVGRFVSLSVADTGSGMDQPTIQRIFEPFFTTKEPGHGTGLGLATVYGILKQHDGWVEVESTPGKGSTFRVCLPLHDHEPGQSHVPQKDEVFPGGCETVLVVEDDPALRGTITRTLRRQGYAVLEASDGLVALELWLHHSGKVQLLLTDMVLPAGISGLELAKRLRQENPRLKVLLVSGYTADPGHQRMPTDPQVAYLAKPFTVRTLTEAVRASLDSK